jgi:hypothetical protein
MHDCTSAQFVWCGKKLKLSSDGGDCGGKKCKRGYGGAYDGVWRSVRLAESCFSSRKYVYTFNLLYKEVL